MDEKLYRDYLRELNAQFALGTAGEHAYRPALKTLLEGLIEGTLVTNEPKKSDYGVPDFVLTRNGIPLGYVEAKNLGKSLDDPAHKEQLHRYINSLDNVIFTNYVQFRLFRNSKLVDDVQIAEIDGKQIKKKHNNFSAFFDILEKFKKYDGRAITTAEDLAKRMASKARLLSNEIKQIKIITRKSKSIKKSKPDNIDHTLQGQFESFQDLIPSLDRLEFADIYAQTIAYGMFAARLHDLTPGNFSRHKAAGLIPEHNPLLRNFFQHIAGYDLDERIRWIVDDLADVFRVADVSKLMKDHGNATQRKDPFLHFYETFLGAYDPKLRKTRGVYYTPAPVVNFIVRAVDNILHTEFDLYQGLANTSKANGQHSKPMHKVQILDPAAGTGTFLASVVSYIHETYFANQQGAWKDYVKKDLIRRLNGFELLLAPYVMAHTKLDMTLQESGGGPIGKRWRVFLTNSLEEHREDIRERLALWLSKEANEANSVKRDTPVMVVIGNPPYSGESANKSRWITNLLRDYKKEPGEANKRLREQNPKWLNDDYVKFIRYGQYCIDFTGEGVLAYVNNHSFLDNPTFRGMRWNLLRSFDKIYILDLHGNAQKRETSPDGSVDKNVFDIKQGVSINLFIKTGKKAKNSLAQVFHHELYGTRESKYQFLWDHSLSKIGFRKLKLLNPYYFFVPKNIERESEYVKGFSSKELFTKNSTGIVTGGDSFIISKSRKVMRERIHDIIEHDYSEEELRKRYSLGKNYPKRIINNRGVIDFQEDKIIPIAYRLFDTRWTYYDDKLIEGMRYKVMRHFRDKNLALVVCRQFKASDNFHHVFITENIFDSSLVSDKTSEVGHGFPLYLYVDTDTQQGSLDKEDKKKRESNLNKSIVQAIADGLGLRFTEEKEEDKKTFAPIDLLDYIYAVLHAPSYRERYREFLKIDFPKIPYPTDAEAFRKLVALGGQLRALHLMESPELERFSTGYTIVGDDVVTKVDYTITDATKRLGRVFINKSQYFSDVPEVAWDFTIGGYQPAQKWLKDRKNRALSAENVRHYQKIIVALVETDRLMSEIDSVLDLDAQ